MNNGPGRTQQGEQSAAQRAARVQRQTETHPLSRLQRQVGNQAVAGMLAQREEEDEALQAARDPAIQREEEEEALQASRDVTLQREEDDEPLQAFRDVTLQREGDDELQMFRDTTVQREGEDEELQASRDPAIQRATSPLQRLLAPFAQRAEDEEEALQAKPEVGMEGGPVSDATAQRIQAVRSSGGSALDTDTRSHMEGAFDTSFDDVRVHTGSEASAVSRQIGALAFTAGSDVFMRDDAYTPGTDDGRQLLSHELTHVVQQRSMPASGAGGMQVGPAGDGYERAADAKAADVAASSAPATAQRETETE
jgi:hypothetical protein